MRVRLALVGDCNAAVAAHRAIPEALRLASRAVEFDWKHTSAIGSLAG